jgi:hypothetical protein
MTKRNSQLKSDIERFILKEIPTLNLALSMVIMEHPTGELTWNCVIHGSYYRMQGPVTT